MVNTGAPGPAGGSDGGPGGGPERPSPITYFGRLGGQPFFDGLADHFYERIRTDPVLQSMFPDDLTAAKRHLATFLAQFWGGPSAYLEERGHPALRRRHAPFPISPAARDAWVAAMREALDAQAAVSDIDEDIRAAMEEYFDRASTWLINEGSRHHPGLELIPPDA